MLWCCLPDDSGPAPDAASVRLLRVELRASDSAWVAQGRNNGGGGGGTSAAGVLLKRVPGGLCNPRDRRGWRLK